MPFKPSNYKMDWIYSVLLGSQSGTVVTFWRSLLPYGYSYKASCARPG